MKNELVSPCRPVPVKSGWRNYTCYYLQAEFTPPQNEEIQQALAERIRLKIGATAITPDCRQIADGVWLCAFYHASTRLHRMPTYEEGQFGALHFHRREAATFIFDSTHHIFYLSVASDVSPQSLISTLPGLILPTADAASLPLPYTFDLTKAPCFCEFYRQPEPGSAAWNLLKLRMVNSHKPGLFGERQECRAVDLLEDPGFFHDHMGETLQALTLSVYTPARKRPFSLLIHDGSAAIRTTIIPESLAPISAILNNLSRNSL